MNGTALHIILVILIVAGSSAFILHNSAIVRRQSKLDATHKVTIVHEGKETVLDVAEDCSVLDAALDAGIELPHDCKLGVCLTCPSKVLSGEVDQTGGTLDDSVMEKGYALTCMTYPRSDVKITSIDEDELVNAQFSDRD